VNAKDTQTVKPAPKQDQNGPVDEVQTYQLTAKNECGGSGTQTASVHIVGSIEPIPELPLASIFFPTGYPDQRHPELGLVKSQRQRLARTAEGFKKYLEYDPDAKLTLFANADQRDSKARNKGLSERRGNLAKQYLVSLGIPENKIEVVAQGKEKQLDASAVKSLHAQNPTATKKVSNVQVLTWAYNRRVDIGLMPKDVRSSQYFPGDAEDAAVLADSNWPDHKDNIVILAAEKERLPVDPK
jgi:OmpA family protein